MTISPVTTGTPVPGTSTSTVVPEPVDDDTAPTASAIDAAARETKSPGVLRLLEAGHFRGVADVRLRVVHAERIASAAAAAAESRVRDAAGALSTTIVERVTADEGTAAADATVGPTAADLETAFEAAVDDFFRAGAPEPEMLTASLASAFDAFVASLTSVTGTDAAPADDAAPTAAEPPADLLTELEDLFTAGLEAIVAALAERTELPPPGDAHGNGRAYEKFLAEYLALGPTAQEPAPADAIDIEA